MGAEPTREGQAIDLIIEVDTQKQRLSLPEHSPFMDVGRSPQNHLVLEHPTTLSWRHLTIRWSDGWWVQDTSTNGSLLNGVWFRGCTVALGVDDVLELEGHVLIIHDLPELTDTQSTERKACVKRLVLVDGMVEIYPSYGTVKTPIPPQQYGLLRELALLWTGSGFTPLSREREFVLLGGIAREKDPAIRLHQKRARLRKWWRNLRNDYPRELQSLPADIIRAEGDSLRLMLDIDAVEIEGRELSRS